MEKRVQIGWAVRFNESEQTNSHLDILRENGKVLWGQWRNKPTEKNISSKVKKSIENEEFTDIFAIGQSTVWKMHAIRVMTTQEVIDEGLNDLIPPYYSIKTPVYGWFLIDDIKDYGNLECLGELESLNCTMEMVHQIPGFSPWRVFSGTSNNEINFKRKPKVIPKTVNKYAAERGKLTPRTRYEVFKRDNFRCQICGRSAKDGAELQADHTVPISRGGKTEWDNLRTLCRECNLGKSNMIE